MGEIGNQQALSFLIDKAQDESYYLSMNAIESLGELGNANATDTIIMIMVDTTREINVFKRLACAQALVKIGVNSQKILNAIQQAITIVHNDCIGKGIGPYVEDQMKEAYNELAGIPQK